MNYSNQRTGEARSDGTVTTWTFDDSLQLTNEWRTNPSAGALGVQTFNNTYSYDPAGNRTLKAAADGTLTTSTYDKANRPLQSVAWTPPSLVATTTYGYDAVGHCTLVQEPSGYTYYHWDAAGNLAAAEPPAGVVTFVHDAERRRVGKTSIDGSFTRFVYDAMRLLQETAADGSEELTYTSATDEPYGSLLNEYEAGSGTNLYYQYDAQASTEALSDDAGNVLGPYAYQAFGLIANASMSGWADLSPDLWGSMGANDWGDLPVGPQSNFAAFGQNGAYLDPETQLYLMGAGGGTARYYDPVTGRFISEDRTGLAGGDANLFRYCGNDPVNRKDPSGAQNAGSSPLAGVVNTTDFSGQIPWTTYGPVDVDIYRDFPRANMVLWMQFGWDREETQAHQHDPLVLIQLALDEYNGPVVLNEPADPPKEPRGRISPEADARFRAERSAFLIWDKANNYKSILERLRKEREEERRALVRDSRDKRLREILRPFWTYEEARAQFDASIRARIVAGATEDQALQAQLGGKREPTADERRRAAAVQRSIWRESGPQLREGERVLSEYEENEFDKEGLSDAQWRLSWAPQALTDHDKALLQRYNAREEEERRVKNYWKSRDKFKEQHGRLLNFFDMLLDPYSGMPSGYDALFALGGMANDARAQAENREIVPTLIRQGFAPENNRKLAELVSAIRVEDETGVNLQKSLDKLNQLVAGTLTAGVATTDVRGVEPLFAAGSPEVRHILDLAPTQGPIRAPYDYSNADYAAFISHMEEEFANQFIGKLLKAGYRPDADGILRESGGHARLLMNHPKGACYNCTLNLETPNEKTGVIQRLSRLVPNVTFTFETESGSKPLVVKGGQIVNP